MYGSYMPSPPLGSISPCSELVSQDPEIYNVVSDITGIVCAPIVFALLAVVLCE